MAWDLSPEDIASIQARSVALSALLEAVRGEIEECAAFLKKSDTQFWRRIGCRSIFASIEALTNHLKQNALLHTTGEEEFFTDAERMALSDREYTVDDQGDVRERNARIRTLPNILFAYRSFARICGQQFIVTKDNSGWQALKRAIKVRDRITHPKTANDYQVSDQDIQDANNAWNWFYENMVAVTQPARDAAKRVLRESHGKHE
jgi:hypothetical protein